MISHRREPGGPLCPSGLCVKSSLVSLAKRREVPQMKQATMRLASLGAVLFALALAVNSAGSSVNRLTSLRLLPPVLLKDEKGWMLKERMKHYKAEGVSVAVISDFRVL